MAAGAISPTIQLLSTGSEVAQQDAAKILWQLSLGTSDTVRKLILLTISPY